MYIDDVGSSILYKIASFLSVAHLKVSITVRSGTILGLGLALLTSYALAAEAADLPGTARVIDSHREC